MPHSGASGVGTGQTEPRIEVVGGDTVDWGRVPPQVLKKTILITNSGGDTLKIAKVQPSCGCTTAPLDKNVLAPGDTARVSVSVDVASHSGPIQKSLTITSNDSTRPDVHITLKADLVRDVEAEPAFFPPVMGKIGAEDSTSVVVRNTSNAAVTIQPPVIYEAAEMTVSFPMKNAVTLNPGDSMRVVAMVKPLKEGYLSTDVILATSSRNDKELKLRLSANATSGQTGK
jgi:hypothetical protein